MKTSLRARATHRMHADQRLSDLTLATAVAGLAATIGFGWLAAVTYAGTGSTQIVAGTGQDTLTIPRTVAGGGSTTTNPRAGQNNGSSSSGSSGNISRANGRPHVSTGSS